MVQQDSGVNKYGVNKYFVSLFLKEISMIKVMMYCIVSFIVSFIVLIALQLYSYGKQIAPSVSNVKAQFNSNFKDI